MFFDEDDSSCLISVTRLYSLVQCRILGRKWEVIVPLEALLHGLAIMLPFFTLNYCTWSEDFIIGGGQRVNKGREAQECLVI